jgi:hypothetical protein
LVLADGNQILAAEPGFHSDPPQRGGSVLRAIRRLPDHRSELAEQQPENGLALAFGPAQPLRPLRQRRERWLRSWAVTSVASAKSEGTANCQDQD